MTPEQEVRLLEDLVRCESPSGEERAAVELLTSRLADEGLTVSIDAAGNAVAEAGEGDEVVCLLGHIDTVDGWPPVRREGDLLFGRGSVDAKGPLCTFACALARLTPDDLAGRRVVVVGAVEEEAPTSKGARYVRDRMAPAFCVIGEPSGWRGITLGYKGRLLVRATVRTPRTHSAGQDATAAEIGVALWNSVVHHANEQGGEKEFDRLLPTLLSFRSDDDDLIETASLAISLRLPLEFDADAFGSFLRDSFPDASFEVAGHESAFRTGRVNPLVKAMNRSIRRAGATPRFVLKTGTSDMNVVGPAWRCPIVAYGPGDSALDHTPNEHVSISEYQRAIDVLTGTLRGLPRAVRD